MLLDEFPQIGYSVSCTTRTPRKSEVHGRDYEFISREKFLELKEQGHFAEWADVHGNFYGTPLVPTLEFLRAGRDLLFDIDVQGAAQLRLMLPSGHYVFILPPSLEALEKRLRGRGQDSEEDIVRRLPAGKLEIAEAHWFDAWIINDNLQRAYDSLRSVYLAATLEPRRRPLLLRNLLDGKSAS
jgi:guanylate kinase